MRIDRSSVTMRLSASHTRLVLLLRRALWEAGLMDRIPSTSEVFRYAVESLALACCSEDDLATFKWVNSRLAGPAEKPKPDGKRGKK